MKLVNNSEKYKNDGIFCEYSNVYELIEENKLIGVGACDYKNESMIYVMINEEYRGNGYGKKLFDFMKEKLREENKNEIKIIYDNQVQIRRILSHYDGGYDFENEKFSIYFMA